MKVLRKNLEVRLRQMSPLTLTGMGLLYVLLVSVLDEVCPRTMSFSLFYVFGVALVAWYSGSRGAMAATSLASAIAMATRDFLQWDEALLPTSVAAWNVATRLAVFLVTGWLTVELRRLTRNLEQLVEQRTEQWKAETEEHKATSVRLAEVAEILGELAENISQVFWFTNAAGTKVLYVSPSYERVWDRKCEQLYSEPMSWLSAVHPADRDRVAPLAQLQPGSGGYEGEYRVIRPDGSVRCIRDRRFPVPNAQGEAYRVAGIAEDITEQRETRRVLEMQARVLENMAEAVLLVDGNGTIKLTNPALDSLLGYGPGAFLGQPLRSLRGRPNEERHRQFEEYLQQVKTKGSVAGQSKVRRRDNTLVEVEYRASGLMLEGEFFLVIVGQDITQRRREGLMKEVFLSLGSELSTVSTPVEAARAVYAAADKLWKWDAATLGVYSPASDRMEPVLFCDVIGGKREEFTPPIGAGAPSAKMRRVMQQGAELILRRQGDPPPTDAFMFGDTSRVSASIMYVPLRRENQRVGMLSIQSYTPNAYTQEDLQTLQALADYCGGALERIQAEVARRQGEELNRTILATALDGFHAVDVAADPLGAITDANDAYSSLTGYSREELRRMRIADLEAKESPEEAARHLERIVASREDRFETRLRRKDGSEIDVEISASHLPGSNKRVFGFVRDITERKRADRTREVFLSLGTRLNEVETPLAAARAVCEAADQLWQWDAAVLQSYSVERDCLDSVLLMDLVNGERREVPPPYPDTPPPPVMRRIMESGPELILRTPADIQGSEFVAFGDVQRLSASLMYAPLRRRGRAVGVLSIQSYAFNAFTPEDLRTLQALADQCGGALERIRAGEALRESEQRYHSLVDNLNVGVYRNTPGPEGRFLQANPALTRMLGYGSVEECQRLKVADTYQNPGERARLMAHVEREGTVVNYELRLKKKDGTPFYASINATAHHGPNGEVDWLDGILQDITETRQAQEALRASEERYRALAETSPDAIFIIDRNIRVAYVNSAAAALWNRRPEEIIGRSQQEIFPPATARHQAQVLAGVLAGETPAPRDEKVPFPGGERWIETRLVPMVDEGGSAHSVMGVSRDITDRKRAEAGLQAQRDLAEALSLTRDLKAALKSLLEIAIRSSGLDSGAVYLRNEEVGGMDLTAHHGGSPGFVQAVDHWPPDSPQMRLVLQGKPVFGLYRDLPIRHDPPRQSEGLRATAFIPLCHERKPVAALVLSSHRSDEIPASTQTLLNTIVTQAVGAIARIRAEGERHKLEGQLLEITDREQARIGQDLHDGLCQQLVSLAFDANSLQRELTAKRRPEARIARRLAAFLDESITEARALSRGLFPVRLEREGLPSALEELARTTRRRYKVRCSFRVRGTVIVRDGTVATHLYRIAQEAVTNAIKHAQPGAISIRLAAQTEQIELKVEDDGTGVRPKPSKAGTGMGLHIMDYRARSVGGTLQLTRRPRGGTMVLCCVPQQME